MNSSLNIMKGTGHTRDLELWEIIKAKMKLKKLKAKK